VHRPLQHTPGVLAENRRRYELLVEMVEHYAAQADVERVLKAATLAANYAWLAPIGLLSDVRLERTVVHAVRGSGRVTVDGDRPRLSVSLPFLPDDELRGDRTEACLIALLARTGRTADDCGDVNVDSRRPPQTGPEFTGELPFTDEALDWLEGLVSSPLWSASTGTGHGRSTPEPMVSASA
jgi:hypothetical protein